MVKRFEEMSRHSAAMEAIRIARLSRSLVSHVLLQSILQVCSVNHPLDVVMDDMDFWRNLRNSFFSLV